MPAKEGKNVLVIIDNLEDFADKSLSLISDESDAGRLRLITLFERANENYKKPWYARLSRHRGPEVQETINAIAAFPDAYTRLQEFKLRIEKGEWHPNSSFNYFLFVEIIKSVPGYARAKDNEIGPIVARLKTLISTRIDGFMVQFKINQKLMEVRAKELQQTHQSSEKSVEHVQITNNLETAKTKATTQQSKPVFCLTFKNKIWELSWIDLTGKVYKLEPSDELVTFLIDNKIEDVELLNLVHMKRIKRECVKTRDAFLNKTQLLINPKDPVTFAALSNYNLILQGTGATFVLRGKPNEYSLSWINTLSQEKEIPLAKYPQFKAWLDTLNPIAEEHMPQLKSYLLHVNTKKSLEMDDDFKQELKNRLLRKPIKVSPPKVNTTKRLDMSLFAEIEQCVGKQKEKEETTAAEPKTAKVSPEKAAPRRLNVENFAVASLFGHKAKGEIGRGEEGQPAIGPSS